MIASPPGSEPERTPREILAAGRQALAVLKQLGDAGEALRAKYPGTYADQPRATPEQRQDLKDVRDLFAANAQAAVIEAFKVADAFEQLEGLMSFAPPASARSAPKMFSPEWWWGTWP